MNVISTSLSLCVRFLKKLSFDHCKLPEERFSFRSHRPKNVTIEHSFSRTHRPKNVTADCFLSHSQRPRNATVLRFNLLICSHRPRNVTIEHSFFHSQRQRNVTAECFLSRSHGPRNATVEGIIYIYFVVIDLAT